MVAKKPAASGSGVKKSSLVTTEEDLSIHDELEASKLSQAFTGADESDVIEGIYKHYSAEAKNMAGEGTGEQIVFKEDALKAGAEAIETLKGLKGSKLESYMKNHFDAAWNACDINEEGLITF